MLKGKTIGLRAIDKVDLWQLLEWRNQPNYRKFFREYRELSMIHQENWFEDKVLNDTRTVMFAIIEMKSQKLIGACGLCYIDWVNRNADFSIYIGDCDLYIDDNYAVEAAKLMIKYGFDELNLHRLWTEIYDFDIAKKNMFETLTFSLEGRHKQTHWTDGKWCDSLYYGLVRNEEK